MNPVDFVTDLFNPDLAFLPKALAIAVISSVVCGIVGTHVVLRGMAFIGDAVSHAVFPGLAVAFVVGGNLVLGGVLAGVLTAVLVAVFTQNRRLNESSVIGVLFVAAFALGVVIISQTPGYAGSLESFLFGSITGIPDSDLYIAGGTAAAVVALMFMLHKEFLTVSLDRESARALGVRVFWLDLLLYVLVTLAVVISVQTIGNVLVLALLVTPAATARLLTDRLGVMMTLSPLIGGLGALIGLYISWSWDLPTGGTIVLVLTAVFLLAWFFAPRQGLLATAVHRRRTTPVAADPVPTSAPTPSTADPDLEDPAVLGPVGPAAATPATAAASPPPAGVGRPRWPLAITAAVLATLGAAALVGAALSGGSDGDSTAGDSDDGAAVSMSTPVAPPAPPTATTTATPTADRTGAPATTRLVDLVDPAWTSRMAAEADIPERALAAYAGAALAISRTEPGCGLGWNTLAAIGGVESSHGAAGGAALDSDGVATPAIVGVALDGTGGTSAVADTDGGRYDGDTRWDRAVGPMQFIPSTWADAATDGNGDGVTDVNQIDDAALSAGQLLCQTGGDLTDPQSWVDAVTAYNGPVDYTNEVAATAARYAELAQ